jgi:preprotein translocase subunit SecD
MEQTTSWIILLLHFISSLFSPSLFKSPSSPQVSSLSTTEIKWEIRAVKEASEPKPEADFILMEGLETGTSYPVSKQVLLDPQYFKEVTWKIQPGNNGEMHLEITLTQEGGRLFAKISRQYINRELALIANGKVISVPKVMSEMTEAKLMVTFPPGKHPPLEKLLAK